MPISTTPSNSLICATVDGADLKSERLAAGRERHDDDETGQPTGTPPQRPSQSRTVLNNRMSAVMEMVRA